MAEFLRYGIHQAIESPEPLSIRDHEQPVPLRPDMRRQLEFRTRDLGRVSCLQITPLERVGERTVLYLHGGGFCCCSSETHRTLCARLALASSARVEVLDYRLAPEHPFPAAIDDAVCAYKALLATGTHPRDITFAGDSAGGGLCISTLVRLRQLQQELPAGVAVFSPWVDLGLSAESLERNADSDYLSRRVLSFFARSYLGDRNARDPLASPLFADLAGLPPLLIHTGELEVLADEGRSLAKKAGIAGVDTTFQEWEGCFHDFHSCALILPEAREALSAAGHFLDGVFSATEMSSCRSSDYS